MATDRRSADGEFRQKLRREMIARRQALPPAELARRSAAIRAHLDAAFPALAERIVGFCWPVQNEPDLLPLAAALRARGGRVALPVVVRPGEPLAFREWWPEQPLLPDRYDIPTPTDGDFLTPEVLLLPVNAVDAGHYRLGYGGGFFDRTLAALSPRPLAIGVGFDFQRVDSIRPQAHDLPLDAMVTESGCRRPAGEE
ncbi:5-formyltetrahydrofolate cyclo-ligase [Azospira restricta]|uniref:5-formyltetrahydrofolate cyclo-ligase n=1 Tax=Azospira restricta TaxID=404405 RepID=A0A974Y484_9RHOO|nr:5-formyltetrahydrofolate cyclo-ligase [Azospira restricta]QRJ64323.1 5-formyltetrahydrofolate cyclo-ligase [Azospira restricta]